VSTCITVCFMIRHFRTPKRDKYLNRQPRLVYEKHLPQDELARRKQCRLGHLQLLAGPAGNVDNHASLSACGNLGLSLHALVFLQISLPRSGGEDPGDHQGLFGQKTGVAGVLLAACHGTRGGQGGTAVSSGRFRVLVKWASCARPPREFWPPTFRELLTHFARKCVEV